MSVVELTLAADAAAWQAFGSSITDDETTVGGIRLRFVAPSTVPPSLVDGGVVAWGLDDAAAPADIDGLATVVTTAPAAVAASAHALGIVGVDHVVVATADLERTCAAIEAATGAALRRVREVGTMRQGFHRSGELVIEVVTHPGVEPGPAAFWGLVLTVADLDAAIAALPEGTTGQVKDAVQGGRRIATVRPRAGLGGRVALDLAARSTPSLSRHTLRPCR